ncbi:MAG: peptidylprolyl isomerase [Patescibacteria group bacterium]|nr:peptidylprolyl isomerase [Patescibacteria group bacterium]
MSNNKMLDGISASGGKKLNEQDFKKAREVVLNFIGEKDKHKKTKTKTVFGQTEKLTAAKSMRIDGIFSKSKKFAFGGKKAKMFFNEKTKQKSDAINKKAVLAADSQREIAQTLAAEKKAKLQLAELKKIKAEQERLKQQAISKKQIEREKKKLKKIAQKAEKQKIKKQEEQEEKKIKEEAKKQKQAEEKRKKIKKIKQQYEKRRMQEITKAEKQVERKIKITKLKNKFKINVKKSFVYIPKIFKFTGKIFVYAGLILIIVIILGYCALSIALLNFHLDNSTIRTITKYMPVPALITKIGVIEYYYYKDTESRIKNYYFNQTGLTPDKLELSKKTEEELAKELLVKKLARKYDLQIKDKKIRFQLLEEKVAGKIAFDQEINQPALFKIKKIQSAINKKENFNQVAKTYGDESDIGVYYSINDAAAKFGSSAVDLAVGQLSDVITTSKGYYLVECYGRRDDLLGLKYIFVKCKTLDQYLNEEIIKIKVWNLVD